MATVDGRDFPMEPGDLILILPYEIHSYANLGGAECQVNVFSPDYIEEFHKMTARKALDCPVFHMEDPIFSHMEKYLFIDSTKPLYCNPVYIILPPGSWICPAFPPERPLPPICSIRS